MSRFSVFRRLIFIAAAAVSFTSTLYAQGTTLTGRVTDSTGAAIPGVQVVAENQATEIRFSLGSAEDL
jgi:hypothetical protein